MDNSIKDSDIAIIGMSCRFPGANDLTSFWKNLSEGKESITFFENELSSASDKNYENNHVKAGAILDNVEYFDAEFFNYSDREVEITDPQQRIFLECAWEALEDAGCISRDYPGLIGVYAGSGFNTYLLNNILPNCGLMQSKNFLGSMMNLKMMIANDKDYLPMRASYKLNLRGPSVNIQTACSTSLVAVHCACQSILNGECDLALAGAANIIIPQKIGYIYQEGMVFSPDGHTRTFDENAKGTVFGSGVGVILLKPLMKAIDDNNSIYAVIKGTAVNNDGALKVGFTTPSVTGQKSVIEEALAVSEVDSETVTYIEAHGTATPLGDPIEITALTEAFNTNKKTYCAIGSVKTNIGHLGWAAGMAGLIKTVLALQHKKIPPSLHFQKSNPQIDFDNSPFFVNTKLIDWETQDFPRRAGVSAFGIGGTNAHIILEEAPIQIQKDSKPESKWHILTLSAKTQYSLFELAKRYSNLIKTLSDEDIPNICYTTNIGKDHFDYRFSVAVASCMNASEKLENLIKSEKNKETVLINKKIAFLFSESINEYEHLKMWYQLYISQPVFRKTMEECNFIYKKIMSINLLDIIFSESKDLRIDFFEFSYPILYSLSVSLVELWKSWGINASFIMGHGISECAAAYIAGIFSMEDGLKIAIHRGVLMQALKENRKDNQISVNLFEEHNSILEYPKKIKTLLENYRELLANINFNLPKIEYISSLTGLRLEKITTIEYWYQSISNITNVKTGIEHIQSLGADIFIEIGLKSMFSQIANECLANPNILFFTGFTKDINYCEKVLSYLGELYMRDYLINWHLFHKSFNRKILHLPTYPFLRQKYWIGDSEN